MATRTAEAEWTGKLTDGKGNLKLESGAFSGAYTFKSRTEEGQRDTNPEELLGAAHAGCYTMQLDAFLTQAGYTPTKLHTTAKVTLDKVGEGFEITHIDLSLEGQVPDISEDEFKQFAEKAKTNCPVSKALAGTKINLETKFNG